MPTPFIKRLSDGQIADFVILDPLDPQTFQPVIQPIDRPNTDGYTFRKLAKKGEPWRVRAMRDFPTVALARGAVEHLRDGLIGELCDITTREDVTFGRMMCLKVTELKIVAGAQVVGGLAGDTGGIFAPLGGSPATVRGIAFVEIHFVHASAPP
jgi:hypothetical protein